MSEQPKKCVNSEDSLLITYTIRHQNQVLEQISGNEPVDYQMGVGQWPVQLELAMLGEAEGECLDISLRASENAFGAAEPDRIISMDIVDFDKEPEPGELIEFTLENGDSVEGQVLSVFANNVEVDFNHPYAGRDLEFEIHIKSIR